MLKCMECGATFEEARPMTESHGEVLYHCPNCLSLDIEDVSDILCEACKEEAVEVKGDRWCQNCKTTVKQVMHDAIIDVITESVEGGSCISVTAIVNAFQDIMGGEIIDGPPHSLVADYLAKGIVGVAFACGCNLYMAQEMAEAWASGTLD